MTLRASWWVGCLLAGASRELQSRREVETEGEDLYMFQILLLPPSCNTTASNDARPVSVTTVTTYSRPVCGESQRSVYCSAQVVCGHSLRVPTGSWVRFTCVLCSC